MTALLCFLKKIPTTTLRAVATNREENIDATSDQVIHGHFRVHRPARSAKNCAAFLMNPVHDGRSQNNRLFTPLRIETLITPTETQHLPHTVAEVQFEKERTNHIVQSRR